MKIKIFHGQPEAVESAASSFLAGTVSEGEGETATTRQKKIHAVVQSESAPTMNAEGIEFVKTITISILWD